MTDTFKENTTFLQLQQACWQEDFYRVISEMEVRRDAVMDTDLRLAQILMFHRSALLSCDISTKKLTLYSWHLALSTGHTRTWHWTFHI